MPGRLLRVVWQHHSEGKQEKCWLQFSRIIVYYLASYCTCKGPAPLYSQEDSNTVLDIPYTAATSPPPPELRAGAGQLPPSLRRHLLGRSSEALLTGPGSEPTWCGAMVEPIVKSPGVHISPEGGPTPRRPRCHEGVVCYPSCGDAGIVNLPRGTSSCEHRGTSLKASG